MLTACVRRGACRLVQSSTRPSKVECARDASLDSGGYRLLFLFDEVGGDRRTARRLFVLGEDGLDDGQAQRARLLDAGDGFALGVDGVAAVLLVPLGEARRLVHVLDDLPPADAGVIRAERNLALLRAVRDDAHLGAAEVVVE